MHLGKSFVKKVHALTFIWLDASRYDMLLVAWFDAVNERHRFRWFISWLDTKLLKDCTSSGRFLPRI
jgi:hypothetical protein